MTNDEIRIAVAECCGWESIWKDDRGNIRGFHRNYGADGINRLTPNYPNDLNACHEMEKTITDWHKYSREIELITWRDRDKKTGLAESNIHATAIQRCEAFLRTLGKWK